MATEAPPPSYESIFKEIKAQLPAKPNADHLFNAFESLPAYKVDILTKAVETGTVPTNGDKTISLDEQKKLFSSQLRNQLAISEKEFKLAGSDVASACGKLDTLFAALFAGLATVDAKGMPPPEGAFVPRLTKLQTTYRKITVDSATTAASLAVRARRFEDTIIEICKDPNVATPKKIEKLDAYIKDADDLEKKCAGISKEFESFQADFRGFLNSFKSWGKKELAAKNQVLAKLEAELKELEKEFAWWRNWFTIGGVGEIISTLGVLGGIAGAISYIPPLAVLIGGIFIGVGVVMIIIGVAMMCWKKWRISRKESEIEKVKKEINDLIKTQADLEKLAQSSLPIFNANIDVLASVWSHAVKDAEEIKIFLSQGKKDANDINAFLINTGKAAGVYTAMSHYLAGYADAIITGNVSKPTLSK